MAQGEESVNAPKPETAAARRARRRSGESSASDSLAAGKQDATGKRSDKGRTAAKSGGRRQKRGPIGRLAKFMREVWAELRKVIWPTRKQMVTYTAVVLVFVIFMIALVSGLDFVFKKGVFALFG